MTSRSARANHPLRTRTAKKRVRHKPKRDAVFVEYGERVAECGKKAYRKSPDHNDRDFCFIRVNYTIKCNSREKKRSSYKSVVK